MNLDFYFPTPIWWEDTNYDVTELLLFFEKVKKDDPTGVKISNFGGWQSHPMYADDYPPLFDFKNMILQNASRIVEDYGLSKNKFLLNISNMWFSANEGPAINQTHIHGGSTLSGTFYLKVPKDAGQIIFYRNYQEEYFLSLMTNNFEKYTPLSSSTVTYPPRVSRLILFPANLQHAVMPNESTGERVSLSFNIRLQENV